MLLGHFQQFNENILNENQTINEESTTAEVDFYCELCDFTSNWENGVRIHMARKHSQIEQLDGFSEDISEDNKYSDTEKYWKTGKYLIRSLILLQL